MCGFIYLKNFQSKISTEEKNLLANSSKDLKKRGPDNEKIYQRDNTLICFYRLRIIDISINSDQPLSNTNSAMAFNGMIYNYKNFNLNVRGDTELLFKLLNDYGLNALDKIDGMYSLVYENFKEKKIIFSRDEFGQKPLFYFIDNSKLIVSSEIKPIKKFIKDVSINQSAVNFFLKHSFFPSSSSIYKNIHKVLPGNCMVYDQNKKTLKTLTIKKKIYEPKKLKKFSLEELEEKFNESCKYISESDTKKALLLSGGVDSSLVYNYMKKHSDFETYFLNVEDEIINEKKKIIDIENKFNDKINKIDLSQSDFSKNILTMFSEMDEPHGDPGFFNSYYLTKNISNENKVIFTGDGADELFLGYETFKANLIPKHLDKLALILNRLLSNDNNYMSLKFKLNQYCKGVGKDDMVKYFSWISNNYLSDIDYELLFKEYDHLFYKNKNDLEGLYNFYLNIFLPEFICSHTDKSLMMNSKEGRSPFLNLKFFNYANSINLKEKFNFMGTKKPLKQLIKFIKFPKSVYKSKKVGFTLPLAKWLKNESKMIQEILITNNIKLNSYIDKKIINNLIQAHFNNSSNNYREIYNLLALEVYLNEN